MVLVSLNYMRLGKKDLEPLEHVKFLLIKQLDGTVYLGSKDKEFFILDRVEYRRLFHQKLPVLHLSLGEAHQIHPLLSTLELDDHYHSFSIEENTAVHRQSPTLAAELTQEFQLRARALYRYAGSIILLEYERSTLQIRARPKPRQRGLRKTMMKRRGSLCRNTPSKPQHPRS